MNGISQWTVGETREQLGSIMSRITIGEGKRSKYNQTGNQEESIRAIKVIKVTDWFLIANGCRRECEWFLVDWDSRCRGESEKIGKSRWRVGYFGLIELEEKVGWRWWGLVGLEERGFGDGGGRGWVESKMDSLKYSQWIPNLGIRIHDRNQCVYGCCEAKDCFEGEMVTCLKRVWRSS